jgi:hypothetical protein
MITLTVAAAPFYGSEEPVEDSLEMDHRTFIFGQNTDIADGDTQVNGTVTGWPGSTVKAAITIPNTYKPVGGPFVVAISIGGVEIGTEEQRPQIAAGVDDGPDGFVTALFSTFATPAHLAGKVISVEIISKGAGTVRMATVEVWMMEDVS